jgi:mRNA-degrading endonuclease RelE of RelBE toxin-antitoxin system
MGNNRTTHKWLLNVQPVAKRTFDGLASGQKQGIFRKLRELLTADDPYSLPFVEMLKAETFQRVRKFRVGDYRVFFVVEAVEVSYLNHTYKGTLFLLDIRNRKEAY